MIWVKKYSPQNLDEVVGNREKIKKLKTFIKTNLFSNILLHSEPGTGKTTTLFCLAKEYLKEHNTKNIEENILELNASDDRGIDTVRNKIKNFCNKKKTNDRFKIIILDEADNMTSQAQYMLKKTIDNYAHNCKFFFSCNNLQYIIEPIQDRCFIINFDEITLEELRPRIKTICENEKIQIDEETISELKYYISHDSDIRSMINILEFISKNITKNINSAILTEVFEKPPFFSIKEIVKNLFEGNKYKVLQITNELLERGCSVYDIFDGFFYYVKNMEENNPDKQMLFFRIMAPFHTANNNGFQTLTQLIAFYIEFNKKIQK